MSSSEQYGAAPDHGESHATLLIEAAVAIVRLDRLRSGIASQSPNTLVAEARGILQAIKRALELERFGSDSANRLEASRDLLQTLLVEFPACNYEQSCEGAGRGEGVGVGP
jgi:hypothetical protein